ncbi:MAG TPA: DUF5076 domain-containing protein [Candidatus Acidoferrum sp.]|nr:DUF5076 domain-containing protein [Candidatus Acidoferrum sp.]
MGSSKQLQIPDAALRDDKADEIARVWVAGKAQHVSLLVLNWQDPAAWGIVLADLARHLVNAYEQEEQLDRGETLERIRRSFNAELDSPTDSPTGRVMSM